MFFDYIYIAPNDYESLSTTLILQAGADGSCPSDARCIGVFITDDVIVEETETLSFHIASLNASFVRVREDRAWKEVHILDNNGKQVLLVRAIFIYFAS